MTGSEHYDKAELALEKAGDPRELLKYQEQWARIAQVHALLALAAASEESR